MADEDDYSLEESDSPLPRPDEGGQAEPPPSKTRAWLQGKRGWMVIAAITLIQGVFAVVMLLMRTDARPVEEENAKQIQELAAEMLGHEVAITQIFQTLAGSGGRRMTVGLDIVLVLGQLPEERVEGAPRPTPEELEAFMTAIRDMEPRIRSRVNSLLQRIPAADYGRVDALTTIKEDVKTYINDSLDGLNFSKTVRPGIGKRRVTDVLLPMFVRQRLR